MAKILTAEQAAQVLQVNTLTMLKYLRAGLIHGKKLGKEWRVLDTDIEAFISSRSTKEEPTEGKK